MSAAFLPVERWKPIPGYEGVYEVSDLGRVRSLDRIEEYQRIDQYSGRIITVHRRHRGKLLRPGPAKSGHLSVVLGRGNSRTVHSLVLEAFVGSCPPGMECLHKNGKPWDNRLENLRWGTRSENLHDAVRHGQKPVGEAVHSAKLTREQVRQIRTKIGTASCSAIAREYGVTDSAIRSIKDGRTWAHVD